MVWCNFSAIFHSTSEKCSFHSWGNYSGAITQPIPSLYFIFVLLWCEALLITKHNHCPVNGSCEGVWFCHSCSSTQQLHSQVSFSAVFQRSAGICHLSADVCVSYCNQPIQWCLLSSSFTAWLVFLNCFGGKEGKCVSLHIFMHLFMFYAHVCARVPALL